jgi:hypothetical protein
VASLWTPSPGLAGSSGSVAPEFVWAALDCPGYFAAVKTGQAALLGTFAVSIDAPLEIGQQHIVIGWPIGHEGRKYFSGTAVFDLDGNQMATGKAIWITIEPKH